MDGRTAHSGERPLQVAAALIRGADKRILIARRPGGVHQGGLWEFPGGKLEGAERPVAALARELDEELGIALEQALPLIRICHQYPDKLVELHVLEAIRWRGEPRGREGQEVRWVDSNELAALEFPAANTPIKTALTLPHLAWMFTFDAGLEHAALAQFDASLAAGIELVALRAPALRASSWPRFVGMALELCRAHGARLMLGDPADEQLAEAVDGVHLDAERARQVSTRPVTRSKLFSVTCANANDLVHARRLGADFVYLAPVHSAPSPGTARVPDWDGLAKLLIELPLPAYALGGMQAADTARARVIGCQGIALASDSKLAPLPPDAVRSSALALHAAAFTVRQP